eukprot:5837686-Prymnesium_polylepis.1
MQRARGARAASLAAAVREGTEQHAKQALVPTLDDLADARLVLERLLAGVLGRPELLARLLDHAGRVHSDSGALGDRCPAPRLQDVVDSPVATRRRSPHGFPASGTGRHGVGGRLWTLTATWIARAARRSGATAARARRSAPIGRALRELNATKQERAKGLCFSRNRTPMILVHVACSCNFEIL